MASMFRTEEMVLCQLFIQPEAAYASVSILGELGILNSRVNAFQRKFVAEVRRCDEMERKLRYIEVEIKKDKVKVPETSVIPNAPNPREITDLEAKLEKTENEIQELSGNAVNLHFNYLELTELKHVLEKTQSFFTEPALQQDETSESLTKFLINDENVVSQAQRGRLGFVTGVISRERVPAFERMLWRISRGNVFLRQTEIEIPLQDPNSRNQLYKTVFVAFFQGGELKSRVLKVCAGFHANMYHCPNTNAERQEMLNEVKTRLEDLKLVLNRTQDLRERVLVTVARELQDWTIKVRKMKAIYHTLNMFNMDVTKKCLIGECWTPAADLSKVHSALADGGRVGGSSIPSFLNVIETLEDPPTYNRTNKYTKAFQNIIDAYGISSYGEINPALYTIITFPFLFAVMFGDSGHGIILTLFSGFMILKEKQYLKAKIKNEIGSIFFGGRYVIFLMGLFSIYTGIIYNDMFSKSINVFGTSWKSQLNETEILKSKFLTLDPATEEYSQVPYPLGIDPVWQLANGNKIVFLNSFKMKLSIIFGVVHMMFGVCLSVFNHTYFKNYSNIILEFIPQILFLSILFFYLVILIFLKWIMYSANNVGPKGTYCAPAILVVFINMVLMQSSKTKNGCDDFMFSGQNEMQVAFVVICLACIPVLLFGKPFYILYKSSTKKKTVSKMENVENQGFELQSSELHSDDYVKLENVENDKSNENFKEIMIHQAIHTIEYVLSTVSHTASYLRLWALSLAHSRLTSDSYSGIPMLFAIFGAWAFLTISILVMMEGLSAFLHTLRLHW
ncbi:vacuolar proton translocating ATPase 116 kDa subunit A isoform, putative [Pediculus humanus corporis]|uniref:V-type proton ATPase subunit a n=1 Tax=Pediculus humanus subsp. corporis TaxID=121224 RepID=E0VZ05_PEDHC|nr:vacuolar proton translocating ATPase 116 kDa subunit A isoform, putative [Pediculus humanus corporis]EEB18611.1 vacuolar proton translocating ATPase 116 kDa subunit A isoform, putative [Pediculus humanus corporis]